MMLTDNARYHFGPKSQAGNDFGMAHTNFIKDVKKPFGAHVLNCFGMIFNLYILDIVLIAFSSRYMCIQSTC